MGWIPALPLCGYTQGISVPPRALKRTLNCSPGEIANAK